MKTFSIRQALLEGLIEIHCRENRITLVNLRLLPVKLEKQGGEIWIQTAREKVLVEEILKLVK